MIPAFSIFVCALTFCLAIVLELISLPELLATMRPEWLVLTQFYWLLRRPDKVGIATAFGIGIVLDVIVGSYLGVHALALCIVSYLVLGMHKRLKLYPLGQQSLVVFVVCALNLLLVYVLQMSLSYAGDGLQILWQAMASAVVWPLLSVFYDRLVFMFR